MVHPTLRIYHVLWVVASCIKSGSAFVSYTGQ